MPQISPFKRKTISRRSSPPCHTHPESLYRAISIKLLFEQHSALTRAVGICVAQKQQRLPVSHSLIRMAIFSPWADNARFGAAVKVRRQFWRDGICG